MSEITTGTLVEITGGHHPHLEAAAVVESIDGTTATVRLVNTNDDWLTPTGEPFEIHINLLKKLPTPTELRRAKRKLRERHIAELQPPKTTPLSGIRTYRQRKY